MDETNISLSQGVPTLQPDPFEELTTEEIDAWLDLAARRRIGFVAAD